MKKIFKGIAILAAAATVGTGLAFATGCGVKEETLIGEYHYIGGHGTKPYGIVVEVKVKNNQITSIREITNTEEAKSTQTYKDVVDGKEIGEAYYHEWTVVSPGWEDYVDANGGPMGYTFWAYPGVDFSGMTDDEKAQYVYDNPLSWYGWTNKAASQWTDHESWLSQKYVGWSVADILAIEVYTNYGYSLTLDKDGELAVAGVDKSSKGEPYGIDFNANLNSSELLITGSTQGSGRLLLAVQNALSK